MKSSIITNETASKHFVQNYRFKNLNDTKDQSQAPSAIEIESISEPNEEIIQTPTIQASPSDDFAPLDAYAPSATPSQTNGSDSFVEELLKKVDEMSDNVIKLQMQMENQESEFNARLQAEVQRAKSEGEAYGRQEMQKEQASIIQELQNQYANSCAKLDAKAKWLEEFANKNESELANTAMQIAKEVIASELSANSAQVATSLARALLADIAQASQITMSLNPADYEVVKQQFAEDSRIKFSQDEAVAKGGVIITSDVANIEGDISKRLQKFKSMVGQI